MREAPPRGFSEGGGMLIAEMSNSYMTVQPLSYH